MRGRLKKEMRKTDICVIGDRVEVDMSGSLPMIDSVEDRMRSFTRRHPARPREDVVAANLDRIFVVFSHGTPEFRPRLLDRFLAIAAFNDIPASIIANKTDLENEDSLAKFQPYQALGYDVFPTCIDDAESIARISSQLEGKISAFVGPSGVGKSSLLNLLAPDLELRTASVSTSHKKGRHTTRLAKLYKIGGGYIADTPGIRELGTYQLPEDDLAECFVEFRPYIGECAFRRCRHRSEPRCAVKAAIKSGQISISRHESFLRMLEDAEVANAPKY